MWEVSAESVPRRTPENIERRNHPSEKATENRRYFHKFIHTFVRPKSTGLRFVPQAKIQSDKKDSHWRMFNNSQTYSDIWQLCLNRIKEQTSAEEFAKWFQPIACPTPATATRSRNTTSRSCVRSSRSSTASRRGSTTPCPKPRRRNWTLKPIRRPSRASLRRTIRQI